MQRNMYEILEDLIGTPTYKLLAYDDPKMVTVYYYPKQPGLWLVKTSYVHLAGQDYLTLLEREGVTFELVRQPDRYSKVVALSRDGVPFVDSLENLALLQRIATEWENG